MLGMLKDGAFFRLVKLEGDSSFQLQPLANSHIEKLEEENKRLKRLLRDAECQLNREKHKTCMSHSKQKHFHTRSKSHPGAVIGDLSSGHLELPFCQYMDTPTPSDQSDTELSTSCPLTPVSVSDGPPSDDEFLLLSCTLCLKKMSVEELENHSRVCSAKVSSPISNAPLPSDDSLLIAVSKASGPATQQSHRIVTRTTRSDFHQKQYEVIRSVEDLQLLHDSLLAECPNRVIPPLLRQSHSQYSQLTEFQRFLARTAAHQTLKSHALLRKFLTASNHDMVCWKQEFFSSQQTGHLQIRRPAQQQSEDGDLKQAVEYLSSLESNLRGLVKQLQKEKAISQKDSVSQWFQAIGKGEPKATYLQTVCHGLSKVCDDTSKRQDDGDEQSVIQDLYSVVAYVQSAQALLSRVQETINEFLYWDEEVKVFEMAGVECPLDSELQRTDSISSVSSSNSSTSTADLRKAGQTASVGTLRWAEANASYANAKDRLDMMCKGLADELLQFDLRKELELKQVLLEFADIKLEICDKVFTQILNPSVS
jgi:hypothetical protein